MQRTISLTLPLTFTFAANLLGGLGAASCVGMLPFWIIGIPGTTATRYARGWAMSFQVLWMYPAAFLAEFAFFAAARWLTGPGGFPWSTVGGGVSLALLLAAVVRLHRALRIMLG